MNMKKILAFVVAGVLLVSGTVFLALGLKYTSELKNPADFIPENIAVSKSVKGTTQWASRAFMSEKTAFGTYTDMYLVEIGEGKYIGVFAEDQEDPRLYNLAGKCFDKLNGKNPEINPVNVEGTVVSSSEIVDYAMQYLNSVEEYKSLKISRDDILPYYIEYQTASSGSRLIKAGLIMDAIAAAGIIFVIDKMKKGQI